MDNVLGLFDEAVRQFSARVEAVGAGDWEKPTPDTEWNVTDLVKHLIDEHLWLPPLMGGHDLETAGKMVESARSSGDHAADWATAATASLQSANESGALERTVSLSRGPTPAEQYLVEMVFDAAVHAWDLGKAIGYPDNSLPDELALFLHPIYVSMQDDMVASGMFAPPVSCPEDASVTDRLVAATGRDPR